MNEFHAQPKCLVTSTLVAKKEQSNTPTIHLGKIEVMSSLLHKMGPFSINLKFKIINSLKCRFIKVTVIVENHSHVGGAR